MFGNGSAISNVSLSLFFSPFFFFISVPGTHRGNMITEMFKVSLIVTTTLGEFCNYLPGCWFMNSRTPLWEFCRLFQRWSCYWLFFFFFLILLLFYRLQPCSQPVCILRAESDVHFQLGTGLGGSSQSRRNGRLAALTEIEAGAIFPRTVTTLITANISWNQHVHDHARSTSMQ